MDTTKGILVVSFGTSYAEARKSEIECIENTLASAFPERKFYRAWTSKKILKILKDRDNLFIPNVKEAMEQIISDGISELLVQPTHILDGIENHQMKEDILSYNSYFSSIKFGDPLIHSKSDACEILDTVIRRFSKIDRDTALVFMGHGTTHEVNSTYARLDRNFKEQGHPNIFIGTVEADPTIQDVVKEVREYNPRKVLLTPFMIVAGEHAHKDMAGTNPESWVCQFSSEGYQVESLIQGLGSYPEIRDIFIEHAKKAH